MPLRSDIVSFCFDAIEVIKRLQAPEVTVMPTKGDRGVIDCLQLLSKH